MPRNPLEDVARGLRVIGERLSQGGDARRLDRRPARLASAARAGAFARRAAGRARRARRARDGEGAGARARRVPPGAGGAAASTGCRRWRRPSTSSSSATPAPARRRSRGCSREMYRAMGLLQARPPRRGRPRGARRPVRRHDGDQDRPGDPARARRRALHRRGVRARAGGRAARTSGPRRSRRCSSGWRTTATASS